MLMSLPVNSVLINSNMLFCLGEVLVGDVPFQLRFVMEKEDSSIHTVALVRISVRTSFQFLDVLSHIHTLSHSVGDHTVVREAVMPHREKTRSRSI